MDKTEAEKVLKNIHESMYSRRRLIGSPTSLIMSGSTVLLLAAIEWITRFQKGGQIGLRISGLVTLALFAFLFLINFGGWRSLREEGARVGGQYPHPLIVQMAGAIRTVLIAGVALSFVWWLHIEQLVVVWMILIAIVANLWGRFIHNRVGQYAYVLLAGAIALAALAEFQVWPSTWRTLAIAFAGIWTIGFGYVIKKYQQRS